MPDAPTRPAAPLEESAYTVSIDEAADRYAAAGLPRPIRRLQKYCARGEARSTRFDVQTLGGLRQYVTGYFAMRDRRASARTRDVARQAAERDDARRSQYDDYSSRRSR